MQPDITAFESQFTGPYPFTSDGIIIGTPDASFDEEMQTMIAFSGGQIDTDTLYHENMHQWWGDNVSEGSYRMTFFKEGLATLAEFLYAGAAGAERGRRPVHGQGPGRVPGQPGEAVQPDLRQRRRLLDDRAVEPDPVQPFSTRRTPTTGQAPPTSRCARSSARPDFDAGAAADPAHLRRVQHHASQSSRPSSSQWLPVHSSACQHRLSQFFRQWFDTAYPAGGRRTAP